jgi:hypothetical protein
VQSIARSGSSNVSSKFKEGSQDQSRLSHSIGYGIDEKGVRWDVDEIDACHVLNESSTSSDPPSSLEPPVVTFAVLTEKAIRILLAEKSSNTILVWRSQGHTDCPDSMSFRRSIGPVLQKLRFQY